METAILWWIFCAIIGGAIGMSKNRAAAGILWGGLLGPIGIIVILCVSKKHSPGSSLNSAYSKNRIVHPIPKLTLQRNAEIDLKRMLSDGVINEDQFKRMQANIYKEDSRSDS